MNIRVFMPQDIPDNRLNIWSQATFSEDHLTPETPSSLRDNLLIAAIAIQSEEPVGFGGLIAARTNQGYGLTINNQIVAELGGAYILPEFRGHGIWKGLVASRIHFAKSSNLKVVCITGNPVVQTGLKEIGATPMEGSKHKVTLDALCLQCDAQDSCGYCPLQPGTSWMVA